MKQSPFKGVMMLGAFLLFVTACSKSKISDVLPNETDPSTKTETTTLSNPIPYDVLNLGSIWKLSVPVDVNGSNVGAATTISNTNLKNGYTSNFFYTLDPPYTNIVRLWCPVNGATTSPGSGSDHPRTEILETPLTWYSQNQTNITGETIGGRLDAVLSVKQHSPVGDIIVGQIHGAGTVASSYPFVMLHVRHDSLVVYVKGDTVGNAGTVKSVLLKNVGLGSKITFSIVDSINRIYLKAACPGATGTGIWNVAVPNNWKNVQVRFSAGNYLQDHDPNAASSLGSKVNLYSVKITH